MDAAMSGAGAWAAIWTMGTMGKFSHSSILIFRCRLFFRNGATVRWALCWTVFCGREAKTQASTVPRYRLRHAAWPCLGYKGPGTIVLFFPSGRTGPFCVLLFPLPLPLCSALGSEQQKSSRSVDIKKCYTRTIKTATPCHSRLHHFPPSLIPL